jgi:hypothetical protein
MVARLVSMLSRMALASIRNHAISKVLMAVGIFAGKREQ